MKPRQRRRLPNITLEFARWFGRPLRWWERNIIFTLERQRRRGAAITAHIVDYPGTDSTDVLVGYINWYMTLLPGTDLVILDKSIKDAYKLKFRFVRRPLAIASERRPNALRGTSFKILYAHDLSPKNADILHRYAFAGYLDLPCYMIIYHTCSGTRIPQFPPKWEREISISGYRALYKQKKEDTEEQPVKEAPRHRVIYLLPVSSPPQKEKKAPPGREQLIFYTYAAAAPHTIGPKHLRSAAKRTLTLR